MHEVTAFQVEGMILYYRSAKDLAHRTELELAQLLSSAAISNQPIDGVQVLGIVRKAAADLRGLKAP